MKKSSKNIQQKKSSSRRTRNKGLRQERLAGDGQTFTTLEAIPRMSMCPESRPFSVVQTFTIQTQFTSSASNPVFGSYTAQLTQVDQSASLINLFDQYRIDEIELWLQPEVTGAVTSNSNLIYSVIDLDDSTALTSVGQASDYASCIVSNGHVGHYRHYIPHAAVAAYTGSFGGFINVPKPWIDTASSTVQHYGVKFAFGVTSTGTIAYDLIVKLHLTFRNVR